MTPTGKGFFCGAGLALIGLEQAGCRMVESNEIDADCCATLRRNFAHKVNEADIRQKLVLDGGPAADFYLFTFPCDRYSMIAEIHDCRTGDELYLHALRHTAVKPPEVFVAENVPGMLKFPVVMETLTKLPGYHVTVFSSVQTELWLPQRRERVIVFASRRPFAWSAPRAAARRPSLGQILEREPDVTIPPYVYKRLRGSYRDMPIISDPARGDVAPTCVAHYGKDRSTRLVKDRRFRGGVRPYSVREYARLQGVPDWFEFCGSNSSAYTQIGNGIPVDMARWIGRNLVRYFGGRRAA